MTLRTPLAALACAAAVGLYFAPGHASEGSPPAAVTAPAPPDSSPSRLVVHEWGTFTSFSGSDGTPVGFTPDNTDLPGFVYFQADPNSKAGKLHHGGTVSMETPVLYFYTDRPTRATVRVNFPKGWITEWYPFAAGAPPGDMGPRAAGQSIRWDVRLLPGEKVRFAREQNRNGYYHARETDSAPVEAEVSTPPTEQDPVLRGAGVVQREKFLFYRGVGTFPAPVSLRALGGGQVRVKNTLPGRIGGLVLVTVRGGKVGFTPIADLEAGAEATATLAPAEAGSAALAELMEKNLAAAGLYPKEARAMVRTWERAWFGENGTRLLYLVPRDRTDELLPLAVEPKPAEVARVLVGRHDFLTPEQEADAERQVERSRAARAELDAAEQELQKIGRFSDQARRMAEKRLEVRTGQK